MRLFAIFIGITGSAGKTTAKDLIASVLERHLHRGQKGQGTLNAPYDVARLVLRTRGPDAYCVTEIAVTNEAGIDLPLALFRPTVGVVTNIGGEHVAAYGSLDGVADEKSKLIRSLPATGMRFSMRTIRACSRCNLYSPGARSPTAAARTPCCRVRRWNRRGLIVFR